MKNNKTNITIEEVKKCISDSKNKVSYFHAFYTYNNEPFLLTDSIEFVESFLRTGLKTTLAKLDLKHGTLETHNFCECRDIFPLKENHFIEKDGNYVLCNKCLTDKEYDIIKNTITIPQLLEMINFDYNKRLTIKDKDEFYNTYMKCTEKELDWLIRLNINQIDILDNIYHCNKTLDFNNMIIAVFEIIKLESWDILSDKMKIAKKNHDMVAIKELNKLYPLDDLYCHINSTESRLYIKEYLKKTYIQYLPEIFEIYKRVMSKELEI